MYPLYFNDKWHIEAEIEELGKVLLLKPNQPLPIPIAFDSKEDALEYIQKIQNVE